MAAAAPTNFAVGQVVYANVWWGTCGSNYEAQFARVKKIGTKFLSLTELETVPGATSGLLTQVTPGEPTGHTFCVGLSGSTGQRAHPHKHFQLYDPQVPVYRSYDANYEY